MSLRLRAPKALPSQTFLCSRLRHVLQVGSPVTRSQSAKLTEITFKKEDTKEMHSITEKALLSKIGAVIQDCFDRMKSMRVYTLAIDLVEGDSTIKVQVRPPIYKDRALYEGTNLVVYLKLFKTPTDIQSNNYFEATLYDYFDSVK